MLFRVQGLRLIVKSHCVEQHAVSWRVADAGPCFAYFLRPVVSAVPCDQPSWTAPAFLLTVSVFDSFYVGSPYNPSFTSNTQFFQGLRHICILSCIFIHFRGSICCCRGSRQTFSHYFQLFQRHFLQRILLFYDCYLWLDCREFRLLSSAELTISPPVPSFSRYFMAPRLRSR